MSDELIGSEDEDAKAGGDRKCPWWAPYVRLIVPFGMIIALGCLSMASSMWQDWQMRGSLDAAQAKQQPPSVGYYGQTRETSSGVRDIEIGIVQSAVRFENKVLLEVVIDTGKSRPAVDWVVAREDLQVGDKCLMKWVDGANCRERGAFKIHDRQ